jgi:vacuolar-type H+-ATPase subunit E/Vma4
LGFFVRTAEALQKLRDVVKFLAQIYVEREADDWRLDPTLDDRLERYRNDVIRVFVDALKNHKIVNPVSTITIKSRFIS